MRIVGQFRDLDDPDRFVWLRGFADMDSRLAGLSGFYGGPAWAAHRGAANATMIDSDDVLLLRPTSPDSGFPTVGQPRRPLGDVQRPASLIAATVHHLAEPVTSTILAFFDGSVEPLLTQAGSPRSALLQTIQARNTFPALPVREGEHVVVRFARFEDIDAHREHLQRLGRTPGWTDVQRELQRRCVKPAQQLRLQPTARSLLR